MIAQFEVTAVSLAATYQQEVAAMLREQAVRAENRLFDLQKEQSDVAQKMLQISLSMTLDKYQEDSEYQRLNESYYRLAYNLEMARILHDHAWSLHRKAESELFSQLLKEFQADKFGSLARLR